MIFNQKNGGIHNLIKHALHQQFLYCFTWKNKEFLILNIFYFLFLLLFWLIISISLYLDPWVICHLLANLSPSFWLFPVTFVCCGSCVCMHKPCHVPHASQITTLGTIFTEIFFGASKELGKSWSHTFLITNLEKFGKRLLVVSSEKIDANEKKKTRTRWRLKHLRSEPGICLTENQNNEKELFIKIVLSRTFLVTLHHGKSFWEPRTAFYDRQMILFDIVLLRTS